MYDVGTLRNSSELWPQMSVQQRPKARMMTPIVQMNVISWRHAMPIVRHRINVARKFFTYLNTFIVIMNVTKPSHLFISR